MKLYDLTELSPREAMDAYPDQTSPSGEAGAILPKTPASSTRTIQLSTRKAPCPFTESALKRSS